MYNNQNNGGRNNYPPRNVCQNFWLRCNSMRTNNNGTVTLNCMLYAKKRQDGSYPATMFIGVYCDFSKGCQMPEADYTNKLISVNGSFSADSYFNPKANCELPQYTIYATSVQIVENNNYRQNNGYQNRNGYRQNQNYGNNYAQQNNNYQNGAYRQNGGYPQQNYQNNGYSQNQPMNQQNNYQNNGYQNVGNQPVNQMQSAPPMNQVPPQQMPPQAPQNMQTNTQQMPQNVQQSAPPQPPKQDSFNIEDFELIDDGNVPF